MSHLLWNIDIKDSSDKESNRKSNVIILLFHYSCFYSRKLFSLNLNKKLYRNPLFMLRTWNVHCILIYF